MNAPSRPDLPRGCAAGAQPRRVLMVSTSYPRDATDWRGAFMRPLVDALGRRKDLQLRLWAPPGETPHGVSDASTPAEARSLARLMAAGGISHLVRHPTPGNLLAPLRLLRDVGRAYRRHADVDVYLVNWLQCALPLPDNGVPAIITALGNDLRLLRLPGMRSLLRRVMHRRRVAICPNAHWMRAPLEASFGDLATIEPVPFGIDARWYAVTRTPSSIPRWIAVTRLTANKLGPLFEWSESLFADGRRELHLYGPMQETIDIPDWVRYHGPTNADALARDVLPTATGLVTLSRHAEGRPQIMLEAMAAGVPIVASRTTAHEDVVRDGSTGILCDTSEAYARAIEQVEEPAIGARLGAAARFAAREEYGTWNDCVSRYLRLHDHLCGGRGT